MELRRDDVLVIQHQDKLPSGELMHSTTIKVKILIDDTDKEFVVMLEEGIPVYEDCANGMLHLNDFKKLWKAFGEEVHKEYPKKALIKRERIVDEILFTIHATSRRYVNIFHGPNGVYNQVRTRGNHWDSGKN